MPYFCSIRNTVSSMVAIPPIPVPITVPAISGFFPYPIWYLPLPSGQQQQQIGHCDPYVGLFFITCQCRIKIFYFACDFTGESAASNRVIGAMPDLPSKKTVPKLLYARSNRGYHPKTGNYNSSFHSYKAPHSHNLDQITCFSYSFMGQNLKNGWPKLRSAF